MSLSHLLSRRAFLVQGALAGVSANAVAPAPSPQTPAAQTPTPQAPTEVQPSTPPATRILADWLVSSPQDAVPDNVRKEAVRSIVNWVGVTVGGSGQQAVVRALATLQPYTGTSSAHLFGRSETLDPLRAAFITGISSHVLDYDDTHLETIIHPAGPVASALFSLAQTRPVSGADLLHAFILGTEIECRLGKVIYPSHYDMGWHITGTCGVFGAAAACGRILGLNAQQMRWALGIAATEAAGLKIMFGSMCKSLNIGRAAENGLLAALLAANNFTSSDESIEGHDGYIFAASRQHDYARLVDGLGQHYEIALNTYKPFACGIVIHPVIDGVLQLRNQHHLKAPEIRSIAIRANPLVLELTGKKTPTTGLEAKFSVFHSAAVALLRGFAGEKEYTDEAARDPQVIALRERVTVAVDPIVQTDEAYITITTTDGQTFTKHVEHAVGSVQNPLSDKDLSFKFTQLATGILPPAQIEELLTFAWNLPEQHNAGDLPRLGALA
ncbi:MmgE/PrpD family protein [Tunturiibacter empetritectus]|uniref:2-methylcitrate dehydratase PrpD n=1 Tax=Tunturiibacter lichenicola TaxID=2051959 RepID=A0A852VE04_9BACT|nr:MmgE/PrpD family protein [Edaphobacter lichenicola]NYF91108.1 2-methylcitrate dehydratase PrpD [Edaphobacter lichenicola]